ncbi:hypothetical protein GCM10011494_21040 [Novosphingobium endophyticum]|uniref:Uncharacterized protein n=1 Tax=Novosphingobium endophyticum TaxID=1955250 RepID=A0A916TTA9_9SPHN|nr:hypothetical protein [Novosphingobium endophyticum]GGC02281.1 hypothetical protein GCM10011494_21040 [Novosphingobium endophyticum]
MGNDFHNRTDWVALVLAMFVWAGHFTLVWAASSAFPDQPEARWIAMALSLAAVLLLAALWRWRRTKTLCSVSGLGIALAAGGVAYDTLPPLLG